MDSSKLKRVPVAAFVAACDDSLRFVSAGILPHDSIGILVKCLLTVAMYQSGFCLNQSNNSVSNDLWDHTY